MMTINSMPSARRRRFQTGICWRGEVIQHLGRPNWFAACLGFHVPERYFRPARVSSLFLPGGLVPRHRQAWSKPSLFDHLQARKAIKPFKKPAQIEKWPHRSNFARTDAKLARTERQMSARIEFLPHGRENVRTERFFTARNGKLPAQIDFEPAGSGFCAHGTNCQTNSSRNRRRNSKNGRRRLFDGRRNPSEGRRNRFFPPPFRLPRTAGGLTCPPFT